MSRIALSCLIITLRRLLTLIGRENHQIMGKSFKQDKSNYSESRNNKNEFKRKRNQIKEEHLHEEYSNYKVHGFNRKNTKDI